jgi:AcrR family transcriptional regulator
MPKTQQQYEKLRNDKRNYIKEIALRLFAEKGYNVTSINQIAKEANMSQGLMYNYFQSKEDLLKFIVNSLAEEFSNYINPNKDNIVTEEEALNYIDIIFDMLKNKREYFKHYFQLAFQPEVMNALSDPGIFDEDIVIQQHLLLDFLVSKCRNMDTEILRLNILSIAKGFSLIYVYHPEKYPYELLDKYKDYIKNWIKSGNVTA